MPLNRSLRNLGPDAARALLTRRLTGASPEEIEAWLALEPRDWVLTHAASLYAAGLSAQDAADLHRRLGVTVAASLARLIDQGRMADIDIRYIHLWAASGLLRPEVSTIGRSRTPNFTRWVSQARQYILACGGDQRLAASAAAAGLSVAETGPQYAAGNLDAEALQTLAALRETGPEPS